MESNAQLCTRNALFLLIFKKSGNNSVITALPRLASEGKAQGGRQVLENPGPHRQPRPLSKHSHQESEKPVREGRGRPEVYRSGSSR